MPALMTFNPPTKADGRWIIEFFAPWLQKNHPNPAQPGELRWFATIDGKDVERPNGQPFEHNGETVTPQSRTFIPSRVTDNPYLANTGYMATLQSLPEPLRSQMLYGDFHAGMEDDPWQVIPTAWVELAQERRTRPHKLAAFVAGWHAPRIARLRKSVLPTLEPILWGKTPWRR